MSDYIDFADYAVDCSCAACGREWLSAEDVSGLVLCEDCAGSYRFARCYGCGEEQAFAWGHSDLICTHCLDAAEVANAHAA